MDYIRPLRKDVAHSLLEKGKLPSAANEAEHMARISQWWGC